jgi:2-oxoglutarate ferredoxin oxidoreductase subunit delta
MSLKIIETRCKGCGICVEFCPKKVLALSEIEKVEKRNEAACIACRQCEMRCPDFAIFVEA